MNMQRCSHGAVRRHDRIIAKQSERPPGAWLQQAYIVRGIFPVLTLALALCVAPFAPGQRSHREFSKRTLTSPSSLLERPRKEQQVQMTADSVKNRHQSAKRSPLNLLHFLEAAVVEYSK